MEIVSTEELSIAYDGADLRAGLMDVQALAPALLASSTLIQKANRILNGEDVHIELKVRSDFRRGSFHVDLHVVQGLLDQAKVFLALHPQIKEAKDILEILFFFVGLPAKGIQSLFELIKFLRRRKPDKIEIQDKDKTVILYLDNRQITVTNETYQLYQDAEVRRAASQLAAPLNMDGIDTLEFRRGNEVETITKEDAPAFEYMAGEEETILDATREAWLSIIALSFKSENKWRFSEGINASIEDEAFWGLIHKQEIRFEEGDQLKVILRTVTTRDEEGTLRNTHTITKVLEHHHVPKQQKFF